MCRKVAPSQKPGGLSELVAAGLTAGTMLTTPRSPYLAKADVNWYHFERLPVGWSVIGQCTADHIRSYGFSKGPKRDGRLVR